MRLEVSGEVTFLRKSSSHSADKKESDVEHEISRASPTRIGSGVFSDNVDRKNDFRHAEYLFQVSDCV